MPTWVKVILIVVGVGFLLLVVGVVVAARWVKSSGEELQKQSKVILEEAEAFGKGKDGEACIAEGLNRLKAADGFIGEAKTKIFLQHCLSVATVAPQTCEGVPSPTEIMQSARWSIDECAKRGWANSQRCTRLIGALQFHCEVMKKR